MLETRLCPTTEVMGDELPAVDLGASHAGAVVSLLVGPGYNCALNGAGLPQQWCCLIVAKSWKGPKGIPGKGIGKKHPDESWRVAFQGRFFAFRTTFSHISILFIFALFYKKSYGFFFETTGSAEPRASENKSGHATLVFQWCPKSLIIPIFKAYERKWPKNALR